jgi:threonyl-tRNA synthetase
VPYILVVGEREREQKNVSVRDRSGNDLGIKSVEAWCDEMRAMAKDYR